MSTATAPALHVVAWEQADTCTRGPTQIILSFDVEEHHRIEAAAGLSIPSSLKTHYAARVEPATCWLLEQLEQHGLRATFFIVGQVARQNPALIRAIHRAGHELASHGWDHRRVHHFQPASFRADVARARDALEQITGEAVVGYRAPTFSIMRETAWGLDVLSELGMLYDSSIYPVRHDRYGVPQAPRWPFWAHGPNRSILEIPPATLRVLTTQIPVGGGGYFRLFPLFLLKHALTQVQHEGEPPVAMLYFHPWEFDPHQARLPLSRISRFRTYGGIYRSKARLSALLEQRAHYRFVRAIDVARQLRQQSLPQFEIAKGPD